MVNKLSNKLNTWTNNIKFYLKLYMTANKSL